MGYLRSIEKVMDERIEKAIKKEPDIRNAQLMERFGCKLARIRRLRKKLGIYEELSDFITKKEINSAPSRAACRCAGIRFGRKEKT